MISPNPRGVALVLTLCLGAAGCAERPGADTVVIITWDAVSERLYWGGDEGWDTIPRVEELYSESAVFPHTATTRGVTGPALASMLTGAYPRDNHVRTCNTVPDLPTLPERFRDAGYRTLGFSSNQCQLMDAGTKVRVCTSPKEHEANSRRERDVDLERELLDALDRVGQREKLFLWLHLTEPHTAYETVSGWYDLYHPEPYTGSLVPASDSQLDDIIVGQRGYDEADKRHLEAAYASQIRDTDARVGRVLDKLRELERYDDAIIVQGFDHGEELYDHNEYLYHGCSPYNSVIDVVYSFKAPGLTDQGQVFEGWVSTVDVAPTIVELAGAFEWEGLLVGRSLVSTLETGVEQDVPVFFERGLETAGVIWQDHKYIISGDTSFSDCQPYETRGGHYPTEPFELYDLLDDPDELDDLAGQGKNQEEVLRRELCDWVLESTWYDEQSDVTNPLVMTCRDSW
jgi:arylsulfatase A-like enzyme